MSSATTDNGAAADTHLTLVPHTLTKVLYMLCFDAIVLHLIPCPAVQKHLVLMMQVVHFIRHGEGYHNIGYEQNLDAHLTPFGWHQAAALGEHIRKQQPPLDVQVKLSVIDTCSLGLS